MSSSSSIGNCDRALIIMLMKHISGGGIVAEHSRTKTNTSSTFEYVRWHLQRLVCTEVWPGKSQAVDVGFVSTLVKRAAPSMSECKTPS